MQIAPGVRQQPGKRRGGGKVEGERIWKERGGGKDKNRAREKRMCESAFVVQLMRSGARRVYFSNFEVHVSSLGMQMPILVNV